MLNSQITTAQHMEREKAYDVVSLRTLLHIFTEYCCYLFFIFHFNSVCLFSSFLKIASLMKIPFLDEEVAHNSFPRKVCIKTFRKNILR
jgi:actin-related protein 8